jgi:hypothetical protein
MPLHEAPQALLASVLQRSVVIAAGARLLSKAR